MKEQIMLKVEQMLDTLKTDEEITVMAKAFNLTLPDHLNSIKHKLNYILFAVEDRLS